MVKPAQQPQPGSGRVASPVQGFGRMWQTSYRIRLVGANVSPEEVVQTWKARFAQLWPRKDWFYGSLEGIKSGDVVVLNTKVGGMRVSTEVLVLYADVTSFTVMTPGGHQFAGFNTFSARRDGGEVVAEVTALVRASDPLFELGLAVGLAHWMENRFWQHALCGLAAELGVADPPPVESKRVVVDRRRQWRKWRNVRHNAALRSVTYATLSPWRWLTARPDRPRRPAEHTPTRS
jgi:hypothetical protein